MIEYKFIWPLFLLVICIMASACKNENDITGDFLKKTPLGHDFHQVMEFCRAEKMKCNSSENSGYLNQRTGKVVGQKSIWGVFSEQRETLFTITSVSVYWGFDKDGHLIDIWVWKTTDGP
jgi:hypothetical protein